MYMTSEVFRGELPDGKTWFALDVAKATKSMGVDLGSLSSQSPADALERLKASGSVKNLGAATIGGVATTHYSAIVDESRVAKLTKALGVSVLYAPVDVWVDAKGLVRRVHMQYVQEAGAGLPEATTQMTMSLSNYGEAVHVAVPPAAETFDATDVATSFLKK
jgi:hypothetical protein